MGAKRIGSLSSRGCGKIGHNLLNDPNQSHHDGNDSLSAKRLTGCEADVEARPHYVFMFGSKRLIQSFDPSSIAPGNSGGIGRFSYFAIVSWNNGDLPHPHSEIGVGIDAWHLKSVGRNKGRHSDNDLMLVSDVQFMKQKKLAVVARIGFGIAYSLNDLFSGEVYFSVTDHRFKSVRFFAERELNFLGIRIEGANDLPDHLIQGRPQIMNGVPYDKREVWRDGLMYVDAKETCTGFGVFDKTEGVSSFVKERSDIAVEVADVLFRAPNF